MKLGWTGLGCRVDGSVERAGVSVNKTVFRFRSTLHSVPAYVAHQRLDSIPRKSLSTPPLAYRNFATRNTCLTCNRRGISFLPLMAFCSVSALPDTYAASSRRFWQIRGTKGVCSRLLCGLVHTCAVHEQGDVRYFACAKATSLLQTKRLYMRSVKALFTTFQFQFPITVALAQMLVMLPICYLVARPRLEWATAKAVFPLAVVNILNVVFGLVGKFWLQISCPAAFCLVNSC